MTSSATHYFGFALASDHQQQLDALLQRHEQGQYSSPEEIGRFAIMGVDGVVNVLAIEVIALLRDESGEGTAILDAVAKLVLKTMHGLLRQLLSDVSRGEQDALADYMLRRRVDTASGRLFGYRLSDVDGQRFQRVFAAVSLPLADSQKAELVQLLMHFIDLTTLSCYDEFVACLEMGFFKRQAAALARVTIIKAGHATVRSLVGTLTDEQVVAVARHYQHMFHVVDGSS